MIKTLRHLVILTFVLHAFSSAHAAQAPGPSTQANQGPICGGSIHPWSVPPTAEPPGATPVISIVCGSCSSPCAGRKLLAPCFDNFGNAGLCGIEPIVPNCSDGHPNCVCGSED